MPAMKVRDYTRLPVGEAIARGVIQVCPYCAKNGVMTKVDDITYYTHEERVGVDSKGGVHIGWNTCPTDEQVRDLLKKKEAAKKKENPKSAESE